MVYRAEELRPGFASGIGHDSRQKWSKAHILTSGDAAPSAARYSSAVGQPPLKIDLSQLPNDAVVNDIVYVPLETELLAAAKARKLRVAGGLGMLLHQAVPGFEHWFGKRPVVTQALRAAVQKSIAEG